MLDPDRTKIRGTLYSARHEFEYYNKLKLTNPPKDLLSLYAFCNNTDVNEVGI